MVFEIGEAVINGKKFIIFQNFNIKHLAAHNAILSGEQITDLELVTKLDKLTFAHQIFRRIQRTSDVEKALQKEECSDQVN